MTRERKWILIIGAILLLAGAIYRFYPDLTAMISGDDALISTSRRIAKYRQRVQEKGRLQERLAALNRTVARTEARLLTGDTPALAAVDIQNTVNGIAERSEAAVRSIRVLPPRRADDEEDIFYRTISVEVNLEASIRQVKEMLYRLETADKLLRIDDLRIRLSNQRQPEKLQALFTVEGFMKLPETADRAS